MKVVLAVMCVTFGPLALSGQGISPTAVIPTQPLRPGAVTLPLRATMPSVAPAPPTVRLCNMPVAKTIPELRAAPGDWIPNNAVPILTAHAGCINGLWQPIRDNSAAVKPD